MGRAKKTTGVSDAARLRNTPRVAILFSFIFFAGIGAGAASLIYKTQAAPSVPVAAAAQTKEILRSHYDLLALQPAELAQTDVALMSLLCAAGLPGITNSDPSSLLRQIDRWTEKVRGETERHLYRATDPKFAEHYANSEARLRAEFIVQVLQEDCGVHYNEARIRKVDFSDARDLFVHGLMDPQHGGTCASMPVLYTAVGRRLGYPMKLVAAKEHLFCRWDANGERFNIEAATNGGIDYPSDDYYRKWPIAISDQEMATGEYLVSMTAQDELAMLLLNRGTCWQAHGRWSDAVSDFAEAHRLQPRSANIRRALQQAVARSGVAPTDVVLKLPGIPRAATPAADDPTPRVRTPR